MHNVYIYFQKDSLLQNTLRMRARTVLHLPTHRKSFAATSSHCGTDEHKKCFSWVVLTLSSLDSNSHTSPSTSSMVALWGEESQKVSSWTPVKTASVGYEVNSMYNTEKHINVYRHK